jgi:hypothetical protein
LPIEVGVIAKTNIEPDLQDALVSARQQLRSCADTDFVDVLRHGATGGALEKSTESRLAYV